MRGQLRLSLRELLALVALAAVAVVTLRQASDFWWLACSWAGLLAILSTAVLSVCPWRGQAWARGFTVAVLLYGVLLHHASRSPAAASLFPPTRLLTWVQQRAGPGERKSWEWETPDEMTFAEATYGGGVERLNLSRPLGESSRGRFLHLGHFWFATLLGLAGGRLAAAVAGRTAEPGVDGPADRRQQR